MDRYKNTKNEGNWDLVYIIGIITPWCDSDNQFEVTEERESFLVAKRFNIDRCFDLLISVGILKRFDDTSFQLNRFFLFSMANAMESKLNKEGK